MEKLGTGRESDAFKDSDGTVLLVGKTKLAMDNYKKQEVIYKVMDGKIKSCPTPRLIEIIKTNKEFTFGAMRISFVGGKKKKFNLTTTPPLSTKV